MNPQSVIIAPVQTQEDLHTYLALLQEYVDSLGDQAGDSLNLEQECRSLPGSYAPPAGALMLAWVDGVAVGCCALRPAPDTEYLDAAEMKRLYVRKMFRGFGLGRELTLSILEAARLAGYHCVLLDTLSDMEVARALYQDLGFEEIPPWYHHPIGGAHFLKADLTQISH